jgi:hypothetical protein
MRTDGYVKVMLTIVAVATTAIAVALWTPPAGWLASVRPNSAEAQAVAQYDVVVPKAWGKIVGYSNANLLMEDREGVMREIDVRGKMPEFPKVKSIIRFQ